MAEAFVEERQMLKSLRWWDGFVIALCNPGFLIGSLGFSMGCARTWGAVVRGRSRGHRTLQDVIYAEDGVHVPGQAAGISLYAHEGWRGRFSLIGPVGAFGYWIGWSVCVHLRQDHRRPDPAKWFPGAPGPVFDGAVHLGLSHFIAIGCILLVWG